MGYLVSCFRSIGPIVARWITAMALTLGPPAALYAECGNGYTCPSYYCLCYTQISAYYYGDCGYPCGYYEIEYLCNTYPFGYIICFKCLCPA